MNADLQQLAPAPAHHIVAVILGKLFLAGLGLLIGLAAGLVVGVATGLIPFLC
jgi:hypothetical protein